ncbi:MAG: hypothetical protein GWP08_07480 [Nitrospiraceae bacterium]|nr:hypothetical protein [Nitrospiraceae bacterium]
MARRPIAVLGGGHGGHMMAVDLTDRGYKVHLYEHPQFEESFRATLEKQAIEAVGYRPNGLFPIHQVSTDIGATLAGVEWVHVVVPAIAHEAFFDEMLPHLREGHRVVIWAGDFGSLRLRTKLRESGNGQGAVIIETNTLPYGTRLVGPAKIQLICEAIRVMAAGLPGSASSDAIKELQAMFPCVVAGQHVLAAAFNNPNPMVHPPGLLLNTGRIQYTGGEFYMYREGITEAVARVIREVYDESRRVAGAFGFEMTRYEDRDFMTRGSIFHVDFVAPFDVLGAIETFKGPTSIKNRYITEDLPFGLVPRAELGQLAGVPTPVIDGLVSIGSVICGEDYQRTGRTLTSLGLGGLDREGIVQMVES